MKQNFLPARFSFRARTALIVFVFAILLAGPACVTLSRQESVASQTDLLEQKPARRSRVNLNSASANELEALPGIGKAIADRILEHRGKYGPFRQPQHVMMVRGISDRKFRALRALVATE